MKQVKILRGIPGSGKSTWIRENIGTDAWVCSADHYFMVNGEYKFDPSKISEAHKACFRSFMEAIHGATHLIVVDNTNTQTWEMSPYILAAESYGYEVEIIELNCDPKKAAKRNIHGVPEKAIEAMAERMKDQVLPWWNCTKVDKT